MRLRRGFAAAAMIVALTSGIPSSLAGQLSTIGDIRVGGGIPTGPLAEIENPGMSFGGGLAAQLFQRIALRADIAATYLQGRDRESDLDAPDIRMLRGVVGMEALVRASHFLPITTSVAGGWTSMAVDSFMVANEVADMPGRPVESQSSLQPTLVVGANVGLFGSRGSSPVITLSAHAVRLFGEESKFEDLQLLAPEAGDMSQATYVVVRAGVRFGF